MGKRGDDLKGPKGPKTPRVQETVKGRTALQAEGSIHEIPDPDALKEETREELMHSAEELEKKIENLPPRQRLIALMGFTKDMEAKYLPKEFKAVQITFPRDRISEVKKIAERYALPVNTEFLGNPNDEKMTMTYVVPDNIPTSNNYLNIVAELENVRVGFSISMAKNQPVVIRANGHELNLLGADFSEEKVHEVAEINEKGFFVDKPYEGKSEEVQIAPPEPISPETIYSSRSSYESAKKDDIRIPRKGSCFYLMIKDDFVDKIEKHKEKGGEKDQYILHFLSQLNAIYGSADFTITRQNGYILIINTAERAGSYLTSLAASIFVASRGEAKALVGGGKILHSEDGKSFSVEGSMPTTREVSAEGEEVCDLDSGIYLNGEVYDSKKQRLKGRDGSQHRTVATTDRKDGKWLRLKEHKPSVELAVGGPDKFVGYENELAAMNEALNNEETRLTVLRATAGMGKSRLLSEVAKTNPSMVVLSLDPSGKNIQGNGLVTIAEQIIQYARANGAEESTEFQNIIQQAITFSGSTQAQKIKFAQSKPREMVGMCLKLLDFLRGKLGNLKVVLDDVHHVDRHSDSYIMSMMSSLTSGETHDKVVLSMRPEERYYSPAQKTFEAQIKSLGENAVKEINLNGLNFGNEKIARDFIYHSLTQEFRKGKTLGGDWWKRLGEQAGKFPLAMMTFMDAIVGEHERLTAEERPSVLTDPEKQIMLSEKFFEQLASSIQGGDLERYYREKINKLPENLKKLMQTIALLGGAITSEQLAQIRGVTGEVPDEEINAILIRERYLVLAEDGKYKVQHQTISDSIVDSLGYKEKVDLSMTLYTLFKEDKGVDQDTKLALLHNAAPEARFEDAKFWKEYSESVGKDLRKARERKAYGKSYGTAMTVLGLPLAEIDKLRDEDRTVVQEVLGVIEGKILNRGVDQPKLRLTVSALESLGEGAMMIGKFSEAEEALTRLDAILKGKPGAEKIRKRVLVSLFQVYYLQKNEKMMADLYQTEIKTALQGGPESAGLKASMELQIAYLEALKSEEGIAGGVETITTLHGEKMSELAELRKQGGSNLALSASAEIARLVYCRVPFERIRDEVTRVRLPAEKKKEYDSAKKRMEKEAKSRWLKENGVKILDDDILFQRAVLDQDQLRELMEIAGAVKGLEDQQKQNPELFSPHAGMSLLDIKAQVSAMMGRSQEAVDILSEYWRQANQMEMHSEAARAAKMKGDIQMVQAFSGHNINRGRVLEAIRTYSEEGVKSLTSVDPKSFYNISMRINRIRAIGSLAVSYDYEMQTRDPGDREKAQMVEEFKPYLEMALKDFDYLNEKRPERAQSGEIQYYLQGYLGHVFKFAKKNRLELPDINDPDRYPYAGDGALNKARSFAEGIEDNPKIDLGEKPRKMAGIDAMQEFVGLDLSME